MGSIWHPVPPATQAPACAPCKGGNTVLLLEGALPQHKQLQIKRWRQSWHWAPTLPSPIHNQVNVLVPRPSVPHQPSGTPLCQHLSPASPQSHPLLSLLASRSEPSAHSPALSVRAGARRAVLGGQGARSPNGLGTAPGGGGTGQHPPLAPQGRWVPGGRCCAGRPWGGSHTSPSSASASGSGV